MEQEYPGSQYQPLFDLMMNEHNLTLLHTELNDIIDVVRKMEQPVHGLRWVKGAPSERRFYFAKFMGKQSDLIYFGVIEPVSNQEYWQAVASGCRTSIKGDRIIEWLDESAPLTAIPEYKKTIEQLCPRERKFFDLLKYILNDEELALGYCGAFEEAVKDCVSPATTGGEINNAMIDAVYEGAELWQREYDNCRKILQELLDLKMIKEFEGKTEEYRRRQPLAWKAAIEFLNEYQHLGE